jgi:uncharacterized membrane protein YqhA
VNDLLAKDFDITFLQVFVDIINVRQLTVKIYIKLGSGFVSTAVACKMRQKAIYHTCTAGGKDTVQAV